MRNRYLFLRREKDAVQMPLEVVVLEEQIGDVVQVHQPVEGGRGEAGLPAEVIDERPGGFIDVVDEPREFGRGLGDVMVEDGPLRLVEPRFEREVRDPRGAFAQLALFPEIVVVGLQRDVCVKKPSGEPLQQHAGNQPVKITFVREDDFGFYQIGHDSRRLVKSAGQGEQGIFAKKAFKTAESPPS